MSDFEFGLAPARTRAGGPRKRSAEQQKYDGLLVQLAEMWDKAGRPSASNEKPCAYIPVTEEDYDDKVKMLRSAATFTNLSVRLYDSVETEDGYRLPVSAEEKREYKPREKKETADTGE